MVTTNSRALCMMKSGVRSPWEYCATSIGCLLISGKKNSFRSTQIN